MCTRKEGKTHLSSNFRLAARRFSFTLLRWKIGCILFIYIYPVYLENGRKVEGRIGFRKEIPPPLQITGSKSNNNICNGLLLWAQAHHSFITGLFFLLSPSPCIPSGPTIQRIAQNFGRVRYDNGLLPILVLVKFYS